MNIWKGNFPQKRDYWTFSKFYTKLAITQQKIFFRKNKAMLFRSLHKECYISISINGLNDSDIMTESKKKKNIKSSCFIIYQIWKEKNLSTIGLEPENVIFLSKYAHQSTIAPIPILYTQTGVFILNLHK